VAALTTADGRKLTYRELGDGPLLVCHPGGPGIPALIFDDLAGLDRDRTLIELDPRGVGDSDPAETYRLEDHAADLDELRAHLGLETIDLFGHSAGGFMSIVYAATCPMRVRKLVLCGTFARFTDESREIFGRFLAERESDRCMGRAGARVGHSRHAGRRHAGNRPHAVGRGSGGLPQRRPRVSELTGTSRAASV
jgi:pimeloyl-ACP methyl ester carboxylesterase